MATRRFLVALTAFTAQLVSPAQAASSANDAAPTVSDSGAANVAETAPPGGSPTATAEAQRGGGGGGGGSVGADGLCQYWPPVTIEICGKHCPCEGGKQYVHENPIS